MKGNLTQLLAYIIFSLQNIQKYIQRIQVKWCMNMNFEYNLKSKAIISYIYPNKQNRQLSQSELDARTRFARTVFLVKRSGSICLAKKIQQILIYTKKEKHFIWQHHFEVFFQNFQTVDSFSLTVETKLNPTHSRLIKRKKKNKTKTEDIVRKRRLWAIGIQTSFSLLHLIKTTTVNH